MNHDSAEQKKLTAQFWEAEEAKRLAPVRIALASAMAGWNSIFRGLHGNPEYPNYTKLIDERNQEARQ